MKATLQERLLPEAARRRSVASWLLPLTASRRSGTGIIVGNAGSMLLTSIVTSALGVVFWWLGAREFSPTAVGVAAAAISASQLLASLSVLGFGTLLISELPSMSHQERGSLVTSALVVAGGVGAGLGTAFALAGPLFMADLDPLRGDVAWVLFFALAVSCTAVALVLDQVLMGSLHSELQLLRNTIYAVGKLAALFGAGLLLFPNSGATIFATWPLANLVALAVVVRIAAQSGDVLALGRPRRSVLRGLGGAALGHHALNLAIQLPSMVLPVLVTALLSAEVNAYFYTAWMIAGVAGLPQMSLAMTLFAIGVREPEVLAQRTRLTLMLGALAGVAAIVVVGIGGDWILSVFGRNYAEQASLTLRLLTIAVLPLLIKNHYIALFRVNRRIAAAAVAVALGATLEVFGAIVGARLGGIPGLSIGWLVGLSLEAAWMLPSVWRTARLSSFLAEQRPAWLR
jgi:O-antigen/teichoic acid export membrane protein